MTYPRVVDLILSTIVRGAGTELDPYRTVVQVHHKDGSFVAERDPVMPVEIRSLLSVAQDLLEGKHDGSQQYEDMRGHHAEQIQKFLARGSDTTYGVSEI